MVVSYIDNLCLVDGLLEGFDPGAVLVGLDVFLVASLVAAKCGGVAIGGRVDLMLITPEDGFVHCDNFLSKGVEFLTHLSSPPADFLPSRADYGVHN